MKTTHEKTEPEKAERKYPYLGIAENGRVVLFVARCTGLTFMISKTTALCQYSDYWNESDFTPLPKGEKIILEND